MKWAASMWLLVVAGCGDGVPSSDCSAHKDAASCQADAACQVAGCPSCDGTVTFAACGRKGVALQSPCVAIACASCHGLDANACTAAVARGCRVSNCCGTISCLDPGDPQVSCLCPSCNGLDESGCAAAAGRGCVVARCCGTFTVCLNPNETAPVCPLACVSCDGLANQAACAARADCHAVYEPAQTCGCAPAGCCTFYARCATGAKASCSGTVTCRAAQPACEGPYVVSYANGCYEGCVLSNECAP